MDDTSDSSNSGDIKQKIIDTASILFAEKNFEGASIRDIASGCGVNIAMISYYFGGKEGLYLECIAKFAKGRIDIIQKILTPAHNQDEFKIKLKLFFESMMSLYASDKHLVKIIMREAQMARDEAFFAKVMTHMQPIFLNVVNYYDTAKQNGVIRQDLDPMFLATITMAMLGHPCTMERAITLTTGHKIESPEYQNDYIRHICETIFSGVFP